MNEFVGVSIAVTVEILQRKKRASHGLRCLQGQQSEF